MGAMVTLALAAVVLSGPVASQAQQAVWVEVSPGRVKAGEEVTVRANCPASTTNGPSGSPTGSAGVGGTVRSAAFGTHTLKPTALHSLSSMLQARIGIPQQTPNGSYRVTVFCQSGRTASTTLTVGDGATPVPTPTPAASPTASMGPHTGGGFFGRRGAGVTGPVPWLVLAATGVVAASAVGARALTLRAVGRLRRRRGGQ